jgi:class 3 adenylate cyclase
MQQIADWLKKLGMSEYAERFAQNGIEIEILSELTDQDLEKLGVILGHRRKLLKAIRELRQNQNAAAVAAAISTGSEPIARDTAERRQLTVMFCDLVGSTELSTRLDPEDLRGVIGAYHRCVAEAVGQYDGFVAKYMGDGALVYFGFPQAHEDDAERAVRAGLAIVVAVERLRGPEPLKVRIGVATGLVVVGDLTGEGASQEQAVVGETPNLAARLQAVAEPGAVVISASTHGLTRGLFEYRNLGTLTLKGFAQNVSAWQVLGVGTTESRFEALRTPSTPLVGRNEAVEMLLRRWEQAKGGDGQVVLISGEPGIGKSRIAQTVVERLVDESYTRLRYFCSPHHQDSALYPSIAQLERAAGFRRDDTDEQRLDKLEAVLSQGTNDLSEAVPLLADLLFIPTAHRYPPVNLTPQKRKEKTLHVQLAQLEGLAAVQPVLMVFEDVHWSDPTTRESLDLLVDRVSTLRVLVIITFRPEFAPPWIGRPHVTVLILSRLSPRQRAEMITHVTGGKALPREIADQIVNRTDGVPLFIEELTKTLVESGIVTEEHDRYALKGPIAPLAIPTSLHASLLARLDRLAPVREVAQVAAALGRQFSHELISAVTSMPKQQLDDDLEQLVAAELMFRRGTPPDAEYVFKHALVQDAAYSTLLKSRRQQIHARIAATLETQFPEASLTQPELLAHHCTEARLIEKAVSYWLKAGQQSVARGVMMEGIAQLRKGLDLLSGMSDGTARCEQELELQITFGNALVGTKGWAAPEPGQAFARARQLCDKLNRPPQLSVLRGQFWFQFVRGELREAEHRTTEMRRVGQARKDVIWTCFGSSYSGVICSFLGKFVEGRTYCDNALSLWDSSYAAFVASPMDPYMELLITLSRILQCLGYAEQAQLRRDQALAEARTGSPFSMAFALVHAWYGSYWPNEGVKSAHAMLRSADEVLALSSEQGYSGFFGFGNIMRGWCLGALGKPAEGIPLVLRGLATFRRKNRSFGAR